MSYFIQHIAYVIALIMCCHAAKKIIRHCSNNPINARNVAAYKDTPGLCVGFTTKKKTGTLWLYFISKKSCKDILALLGKGCTQGEFFGCCNGTTTMNCLDILDSSNFVPCASPTRFYCEQGRHNSIGITENAVCFGEYAENTDNASPYEYTVNKLVASGGCKAVLSARKRLCPLGNFIACCDGRTGYCLNNIKKADFVACTLDVKTPCTSIRPSNVIGRSTRDLVCTGLYVTNENKKVPYDIPPVNLDSNTRDCKVWVDKVKYAYYCPQGHYVACCNSATAFCLDTMKKTDFVSCASPDYIACSSMDRKIIMRKNKSVCLTVFDNKQKGSVGKDMIVDYATCKEAEGKLVSVCPGKFYTCCTQPHCLDSAKAEYSKECEKAHKFTCSFTNPSQVMELGVSVCLSIFDKNKKGSIGKRSVQTYKTCAEAEKKLDSICLGKFYVCCTERHCLDVVEAEYSKECVPVNKFPCSSTDMTKLMEKSVSVCFSIFDKNEKGSIGKISVQNYKSCEEAELKLDAICLGKFYTCCAQRHCLDSQSVEYAQECLPINELQCSSTDSTKIMKKSVSVCFAIFDKSEKGSIGKLEIENYATCEEASERLVSICFSKYYICCTTRHCLDYAKAEYAKECLPLSELQCSSTDPMIMMQNSVSVCFSVFPSNKKGYVGEQSVLYYKSCEEAQNKLDSTCPGKFYVCCTTRHCLDYAKAEYARECLPQSKIQCSSTDPTKVMQNSVSVCFSVFPNNKKGYVGKKSVQSYTSCEEAEIKLDSICVGNFYICCTQRHCLDALKAEYAKECVPPNKLQCSNSEKHKIMEKGVSVCVKIFDEKRQGLIGSARVMEYASCSDVKRYSFSICSQKFYVCCEGRHCLDSVKSEDSVACDSSTSKDINCLDSSPKLVLKDGKGACIMIKKSDDMIPTSGTSLVSDCVSVKKLNCSPGYLIYCCKTSNCLSGAESKLEHCSSETSAAALFAFDFVFLFGNLILVLSCFTV